MLQIKTCMLKQITIALWVKQWKSFDDISMYNTNYTYDGKGKEG